MLTRAQFGLIVLGNEETLKKDLWWGKWVEWARENKLVVHIIQLKKNNKNKIKQNKINKKYDFDLHQKWNK
jgi:superfamily I DNA and/or RNA helicase